jgi:hypothetical protein
MNISGTIEVIKDTQVISEKDMELLDICNEYLDYNPIKGSLMWKKRLGNGCIIGRNLVGSSKCRYRSINIKGKQYPQHRIAFLMYYGYLPKVIDHKNGLGHDNRIANLRACTTSDNAKNKKMGSDNTSGYKGVGWDKSTKGWRATIMVKGKSLWLGSFKTKVEAALAYNDAAIEHFGEFAYINKIEGEK